MRSPIVLRIAVGILIFIVGAVVGSQGWVSGGLVRSTGIGSAAPSSESASLIDEEHRAAYRASLLPTPDVDQRSIDKVYESLIEAGLAIADPEDDSVYELDGIIDGDTFYAADGTRIRIYGIDTPEYGAKCYSQATWELNRVLKNGFMLESGIRELDPYGRNLYYVFTPDGKSVDLHMVATGYARAFDWDDLSLAATPEEVERASQRFRALQEAERLARKFRVGCLWGE